MMSDVSTWKNVTRLVEQVMSLAGVPHTVVANTNVIESVGDTWAEPLEDWSKNEVVNLIRAFHRVRPVLPGKIEAR
ncbi:hypothetical protein [Desulfosoma caldarium]|uniref:hypothetical protein n=1 Tax=Desulfosoma caldarium TaxID=610254 RepID=UPI000F476F49|nr:hypothetical protein [Desulfosoma caldarium]